MTKIIATIGPGCTENIEQMMLEGMSIARLNFAHGTFEEHKETIKKIRKIADSIKHPISIMVDLPGPKMRIGEIDGVVHLKTGDLFTLTSAEIIGNEEMVSVSFDINDVHCGDIIFMNDGLIQLKAEMINVYKDLVCSVKVGGTLSSHKGVNIPGIDFKTSAFTAYDKECLEFCANMDIEIVCQSFTFTPQDMACLRMAALNMNYDPTTIAKIECKSAVNNIDGILEISDGIMVARGDLGIETPITEIALLQKILVNKAKKYNKISVVTTQMMTSMINNSRPTRAESSDVTNAVLDGADYVMLSEETAIGNYPVETVSTMFNIVASAMNYMIEIKRDEPYDRLVSKILKDSKISKDAIKNGSDYGTSWEAKGWTISDGGKL